MATASDENSAEAGQGIYPSPTAGTWKPCGYIQGPRLLETDPDDDHPGSGAGTGEDSIYCVDATSEQYGEAARWACVACARDCSLGADYIPRWRRADALGRNPGAYAGGCVWGWPGELAP